jgi:hypothetical protein
MTLLVWGDIRRIGSGCILAASDFNLLKTAVSCPLGKLALVSACDFLFFNVQAFAGGFALPRIGFKK